MIALLGLALALGLEIVACVNAARSGDRKKVGPNLLVAALLAVLVTMGTRVALDEWRLHQELAPLLERDYPGWDYKAFSYCRSPGCGGHGRGYLLTNPEYPGLRLSVDYRRASELVEGATAFPTPVAPDWLSDDGFFGLSSGLQPSRAKTLGLVDTWLDARPDPDSILDSCWLIRREGTVEYYGVVATRGKNDRGYDDPVGAWEAEFTYDTTTELWEAGQFKPVVRETASMPNQRFNLTPAKAWAESVRAGAG